MTPVDQASQYGSLPLPAQIPEEAQGSVKVEEQRPSVVQDVYKCVQSSLISIPVILKISYAVS